MSRIPLSLYVGDIAAFARSLRRQIGGLERLPSHLEMLNLLSRAGGYRNFQHFRAQQEALADLEARHSAPPPPAEEIDHKRVQQVVRLFDDQGRLIRWPGKFSQRMLCLWVLWSRLPARVSFTEREISELLQQRHLFGDHALLRRELVDRGMVTRTPDGREYKRLERRPPAEAAALFQHPRQ